jgi:calcineurin-like phosphoesterase family protein
MNVWFTSDTHFGHARVIEYSNRPFKDADEMDEMMIKSWNSLIRPGDQVYHLGDFSFHREEKTVQIAKRLMGQKFLIWGNHDKKLRKNKDFMAQFAWTKDLVSVNVADIKVVVCHYAMLTWSQSHHGSWQLHGHSHGTLPDDPHALRKDVGVDVWGYQPVNFDELRKFMATKEFKPVDHHGQRDQDE